MFNIYYIIMIFRKKTIKKYKQLISYNLQLLSLWIAVIMIWRWVWNYLDHYLLPDNFVLSNLISIILWIIILFLNDYDLEELWVWDWKKSR